MPLPHERPSRNYMRELKAVARAARDLADHLGKVNLLPDGFPIEQVEGFCSALTGLPHGTAEGSIAPLRAADSELNRVRQHYIPTYDEDEDEKEPLVSRGDDFDQRLVGLMAAIRAAIEQYKLESGEELDTDITPDLTDVDKANDAITAALEATTEAGNDINKIVQAISDYDTDQLEHIELEIMLASDAGVQVRSAEAALKTEKPRPTVIGWLSDGVDKTTDVLEHQLSKHSEKAVQVGQEFGSMVGELLEINFPKIVKSLKVAKARLSNIVVILSGDGLGKPPSDFDYAEVYNLLLSGEMVPDHWAPFVTIIDFYFESENHHLKDNLKKVNVDAVLGFKDVSLLSNLINVRYIDLYSSLVADLMPLQTLRKLETLDLTGVDIVSLEPISDMTSLRALYLSGSDLNDLRPIAKLLELQVLELDDSAFSDLNALRNLTKLRRLSFTNSFVVDLGPVSNMTDLQVLHADTGRILDLSHLAKLTKLQELTLDGSESLDLTFIAHLQELRKLIIYEQAKNSVDLSTLSHLTNLEIIVS